MTTTTVRSPRVTQIAAAERMDLFSRLTEWRDAMPAPDLADISGENVAVYATYEGDEAVGGYFLARVPMACEILMMCVRPDCRRQGVGRLMCMDALFRAGKRPLVLTANDESVGFAKAVGFKIFGKRRQPDGTFLTRLGWHAPRPTEPGVSSGSSD
jgi:GNAT superfamily N-acetyltransferase